jgi:beta-N-acetylhexosaminidase
MPLSQMVGQMIMTGFEGQEIGTTTCQFIQNLMPGAVVYRTGNVISPEQLRRISSALQGCAELGNGIPMFLAIDHEGQYVTRFQSGITVFPPALAQGAIKDPEIGYQVALAAGDELIFSGVNMILGPVADVLTEYDNTVISQRSYGGEPALVSEYIHQTVQGYLQAGLIPVLKHFPGHGGVHQDSHYTLPIDQADRDTLWLNYLPPFQRGIEGGARVVMTSHVAFSSIDELVLPTTLSEPTIDLLKNDLAFEGIVLSDSMGMRAITGGGLTIPEASVAAIRAGVDMLLITSSSQARVTRDRLLQAIEAGEIPLERVQDAVRRILKVKAALDLLAFPLAAPDEPDWRANSELSTQVGGQSVAVLKDEGDLIPIASDLKRILVIGPTDGWGMYPILRSGLQESDFEPLVITYSTPWSGPVPEIGYLDSLPKRAGDYDLILILTWESHLNQFLFNDQWQINLVTALHATEQPLIVVALKSPTDILDFPVVGTYLTTFGTTRGQLSGLADVLVGRSTPVGQSPLPGIP